MARISRWLAAVVGMGGLTLLLVPESFMLAQSISPRTRGGATQPTTLAPVAQAPVMPAPPVNMLQQPARDAQVAFSGDLLTIHADNSSLAAILRQIAADSGMKITGLGSDERVFGTFGPGAPRDVLADLLNGTAYDLVLIGNASYGAPRELILTPERAGGAAQTLGPATSQAAPEEAVNDQEAPEGPPPPDVPPAANAVPPGVRTPQQLFQQLQQMRQAQQQQVPQQEQQQQTPPQQ